MSVSGLAHVESRSAQSAATGAVALAPYVGMRPYSRAEKDWFCGRAADVRIIADKTLSARLTLLYAPSGVGKSSVLNAGVVPALEAEDCCVLYFDAWAGSDPLASIKDRLGAMAAAMGVADPLAGAPTLGELARLVAGTGKTLVLAFDQFEEFLVNHADALDPLRKEVAALVRTQAIDARVLFCLREEFLAALEPFRQSILTLYQSTYRLEPLAPKDVQDAIVEPALRFGGDVEPALVQELIEDLSDAGAHPVLGVEAQPALPAGGLTGWWRRWFGPKVAITPRTADAEKVQATGMAAAVDLPMLQLICEQIWQAAPVADGRRALTRQLYETGLGGKDRILKNHMRACMPASWRDRLFTAQLMRYLAPPSGMKISYSAADLAAYSGLDQRRVQAELLRLSGPEARILRAREYRGDVRYELQHDAMVRHVAPWRDEVLARAAVLRRAGWTGAAAAVVLAVIGLTMFTRELDVRRNTEQKLAGLAQLSPSQRETEATGRFDSAAAYLLNEERGPARLDRLKRMLQQYAQSLPADYAFEFRDKGAVVLESNPSSAPFVLRYGRDRFFDAESFMHAWGEVAQNLTHRWGIPVPQRIAVVADNTLTTHEMYLESSGKAVVRLDLEPFDEHALVFLAKGTAGPAQEFHERFRSDWKQPTQSAAEDWWIVPRWSLPVWKLTRLPARAGAAYPAFALEAELDKNPLLLLTPAATRYLVLHVSTRYPCTAAEAWARRGGDLTADLQALLSDPVAGARARALAPHLLLDLLASVENKDDARRLLQQPGGYAQALDARPKGNWPRGSSTADSCALPERFAQPWDMAAFGAAGSWLRPLQGKVRIALGSDLVRAWSPAAGIVIARTASKAPEANASAHRFTPAAAGAASAAPARSAIAPADPQRELERSMVTAALPAPNDAYERQRRRWYERIGIWLPEAEFTDASAELTGARGRHFQIALLDAPAGGGTSTDAGSADYAGLNRLMSDLDAATAPVARSLIDAEYVGTLLKQDTTLKALIKSWTMPSVTDLSLLLREVIGTGSFEPGPASAASGRTIGDPAWLLSSLVFWKAYYENGDRNKPPTDLLSELATHLRSLQARKLAPPAAPTPTPAGVTIERGIDALQAGKYKAAAQLFEQAVRVGPYQKMPQFFVERYATRWGESVRVRAQALCQGAPGDRLSKTLVKQRYEPSSGLAEHAKLQIDLLDRLGAQVAAPDSRQTRGLALCLLASLPANMSLARTDLLLGTATRYGELKDWPAEQAWWLALELLKRHDPLGSVPGLLEQGSRFMNAVASRFTEQRAADAYSELSEVCGLPGPKNWCRQLQIQYAQTTASPWNALDIANLLGARPAEAREALGWVDRAIALERIRPVKVGQRSGFDSYVSLKRIDARMTLGERVDLADVDALQRRVAAPTASEEMKIEAARLAIRHGLQADEPDRDRLQRLALQLLDDWPKRERALAEAASTGLHLGDTALVARAVGTAYELGRGATPGSEDRSALMYVASYAGLVTQHKDAVAAAIEFIGSGRHPYAPIIAILMQTRADLRQRKLAESRLNELWHSVDRKSWDARLRGGDERAWYEMLLGYYKGVVSQAEVFDPLRDDSTFEAFGLSALGITRENALTEANFYDALRRQSQGDGSGARSSLERVVQSGTREYVEYGMALQLLRNVPEPVAGGASDPTRR